MVRHDLTARLRRNEMEHCNLKLETPVRSGSVRRGSPDPAARSTAGHRFGAGLLTPPQASTAGLLLIFLPLPELPSLPLGKRPQNSQPLVSEQLLTTRPSASLPKIRKGKRLASCDLALGKPSPQQQNALSGSPRDSRPGTRKRCPARRPRSPPASSTRTG